MSSTIPKHDFEIYAGDACEIVLIYKDKDVVPITVLTKATITLKTHYGATEVKLQKVAVLDAPNGKMTFSFTATETASLVPTTGAAIPEVMYIHDIEVELSMGVSPITILRGNVTATGDVT